MIGIADKKLGRPKSNAPKIHRLTVRLDDGTWQMLDSIVKEGTDINVSTIIRQGIKEIYSRQTSGRVNRGPEKE